MLRTEDFVVFQITLISSVKIYMDKNIYYTLIQLIPCFTKAIMRPEQNHIGETKDLQTLSLE